MKTRTIDAKRRMQVARTTLLLDQPFFGVLALQLAIVEDVNCPTMWTDGKSIGYSPAFVDTLNDDQVLAVLAHEAMHCACGHPWRRDAREPRQWNVAADYAINHVLTEAGFKLPDGALLDAQYAGKSAEWIYDRLPVQPPQSGGTGSGTGGQNAGNDPSGLGEVRDAPTDSDAPTEADWQQTVAQAIKQGKVPASIAREIGAASKPPVDWRSTLRKYLQDLTRSDYSWSQPNRRYLASGLYLPALHSVECGPIAIAIDTSGSVDSVLLSQFNAEVQSIVSELSPRFVDVMYCDAKVHRVDRYERGDIPEMHAIGGGGTDFRPVFDHIAESGEAIACVVYLTDMYGTFPSQAPDVPVIWCSASDVDRAPFGDVVPCNR